MGAHADRRSDQGMERVPADHGRPMKTERGILREWGRCSRRYDEPRVTLPSMAFFAGATYAFAWVLGQGSAPSKEGVLAKIDEMQLAPELRS
jgi:hypothetical protein